MSAAPPPPSPAWLPAIAPILEGVRVVSDTAFVAGGRHIDVRDAPPPSREDDFFDPDPLMHRLHRHLYAEHYAAPGEGDAGGADEAVHEHSDDAFRAALHAANAGAAFRQEGWRVVETLRGGALVALRELRTHRWDPGEYLSDAAPAPPRRGDPVAVWRRAGSWTVQPGFYYALGAAAADGFDEACLVRYYFNLAPPGAAPAVAVLTRALNERGLPFSFKCPDRPAAYARCDSGVLYVAARHAPLVHAVLHALHPRLAPWLRPAVPLLTLPLAPGLAFAEDPENGDSFGAHRTRAIAEGLLAARHGGDACALVLERFAARGIDLAAPHLTARPADRHGLRHLEFADAR